MFSDEVRRTLTDICFEKYNQILVLNQYDITKGPIAKLFGRDGFEKPDLQFDFGTVTDLKVRDFFTTIHFPTILHLKDLFRDPVRHHSMEKCSFLEESKSRAKLVKFGVVDLVGYQHFLLILMELVKLESKIKYCYASRNMKNKHVTREF